jgi:hypothetical protein
MSILVSAVSDYHGVTEKQDNNDKDPLFGELFNLAKGDMQLLLIYKKIEIAAKTGDWSLMNELYGEFKITHAAMN